MYIIRTQQFVGTEIYIKSCSKRAVSKNAEVKINGKNQITKSRCKKKLHSITSLLQIQDLKRWKNSRKIGTYDPMTNPATINLDKEKVATWIKNGAKPTDTVKALIEKAQ